MSRENQRSARYRLTFALDVPADLMAVQKADPAALEAAQAIIDDLAHGRVRGKLLGQRRISGDLTGLARVKFDIASRRPQIPFDLPTSRRRHPPCRSHRAPR